MTRRKSYLDALRIFAIFFVIYTHVGFDCDDILTTTDNPFAYGISAFLAVLCRVAVPLFFMISGTLLLQKKETYPELLKKRLLRFGIVLVLFSVIMYFILYFGKEQFSIISCAKTIYGSRVIDSYWYLYSYIAIILMLPLLRRMAQVMKEKDYLYLFVLQTIFVTVLPVFERVTGGESSVNLTIPLAAETNIFYFLMGNCFGNVLKDKFFTKKNLWIINIVGVLCIFATVAYITVFFRESNTVKVDDTSWFVFLAVPVFALFADARCIFSRLRVGEKASNMLAQLGAATFGVYLLEFVLRHYTGTISDFLASNLPVGVSGIAYTLFVLIVCLPAVWVLRKIPLVNRLI